jgi:hypothetical protein
MNWIVKADLPTPALTHTIRQTARIPLAFFRVWGLTATTDDDEFVLSQKLGLCIIRSAVKPKLETNSIGHAPRRTLDMITLEWRENKTVAAQERAGNGLEEKERKDGTLIEYYYKSKE